MIRTAILALALTAFALPAAADFKRVKGSDPFAGLRIAGAAVTIKDAPAKTPSPFAKFLGHKVTLGKATGWHGGYDRVSSKSGKDFGSFGGALK